VTGLFTALHESGCGTNAKWRHVCFSAAVGAKADLEDASLNNLNL
jgi:hypothetical protein